MIVIASSSRTHARRRGFTLIEVVLAIGIAIGLLVAALSFYHQSSNLRGQLLAETDRLAAVRLVLDRLTTDLRLARAHDWYGFTGDSSSLRFIKAEAQPRTSSTPTDLFFVEYGVHTGLDGTNVLMTALAHDSRPVIEARELTVRGAAAEAVVPAPSIIESNPPPNVVNTYPPVATPVEPLSEVIRFVRYRYWDGESWAGAWDAISPPLAVEVSLGTEPLPSDATEDDYPFELFQRVVAIPGGRKPEDDLDLFFSNARRAHETKAERNRSPVAARRNEWENPA